MAIKKIFLKKRNGFNEKKYIKDQNELDSYETLSISNNASNPTIMDYDGVIIAFSRGNAGCSVHINGHEFPHLAYAPVSPGFSGHNAFLVKKGDEVAVTGNPQAVYGRFYKKRDYTSR